jgi:putative transposase
VKGLTTAAEVESDCRSFKQAFLPSAMGAEMTQHLGYSPGEAKPDGQANHRNRTTDKTVLTDNAAVRIEVPSDRDGSFEPQIIPWAAMTEPDHSEG